MFRSRCFIRSLVPALTLAALLGGAVSHVSAADVVVYSNADDSTTQYLLNGGATGTSRTTIVADDITILSGFTGRTITSATFAIQNANATTLSFTPILYFYANSASGMPGTLLLAYSFNTTLPAMSGQSFTLVGPLFTPPTDTFWAGMAFSSSPFVTDTPAQLNNLGQFVSAMPTAGSSQDKIFQSSGPAATVSSPPGSIQTSPFGGQPAGNFYWSFTAAPEPSQYAALGLGVVGLTGLALKARKRSPAA